MDDKLVVALLALAGGFVGAFVGRRTSLDVVDRSAAHQRTRDEEAEVRRLAEEARLARKALMEPLHRLIRDHHASVSGLATLPPKWRDDKPHPRIRWASEHDWDWERVPARGFQDALMRYHLARAKLNFVLLFEADEPGYNPDEPTPSLVAAYNAFKTTASALDDAVTSYERDGADPPSSTLTSPALDEPAPRPLL